MDEHQLEPHCHLVLKSVIAREPIEERHWESALCWSLLRENSLEKTTQIDQWLLC